MRSWRRRNVGRVSGGKPSCCSFRHEPSTAENMHRPSTVPVGRPQDVYPEVPPHPRTKQSQTKTAGWLWGGWCVSVEGGWGGVCVDGKCENSVETLEEEMMRNVSWLTLVLFSCGCFVFPGRLHQVLPLMNPVCSFLLCADV